MNTDSQTVINKFYSLITNPIKYIYFTMVADILIAPLFLIVNHWIVVILIVIWVWTVVMIHEDREQVKEYTGWKPSPRFYAGAVPLWGIAVLVYYLLQRKALYKRADELEEHEPYSI